MLKMQFKTLTVLLCATLGWDFEYPKRYENCKVVVHVGDTESDLKHCFDIQPEVKWFGAGGDDHTNIWPLVMDAEREEQPLLPGDWIGNSNRVINRFWINSEGISIKVDEDIPLFTKIERNITSNLYRFCLIANYKYPYLNDPHETKRLVYTMCKGYDMKHVYESVASMSFQKPSGIPKEDMFKNPIWSSPALSYPKILDSIIDYAAQATRFVDESSKSGLILFGAEWQGCSGDFSFQSNIVPDPKEFLDTLKLKNFGVMLTVTPFFGQMCMTNDTQELHNKKIYFIRDSSDVPLFIMWNGKSNALVDFTSDEAVAWWTKRLTSVKETLPDIDSFLFDEGLITYLPKDHVQLNASAELQPGAYITSYLKIAASYRNDVIVGSGYLSQEYPLFVKMPPVTNDWNGLKAIVPRAVQMGMLGFPFILPPAPTSIRPDDKLFIRWLQVNALMPAFHLQLINWNFNATIFNIVNDLFKLRAKYVEEIIYLGAEFANSGIPIIRPLWWLAPMDPNTYGYSDQFALGDNIIVAPIVDESDTRNIYLPEGKWFDELRKTTYTTKVEIFDYKASLEEIPIFTRVY